MSEVSDTVLEAGLEKIEKIYGGDKEAGITEAMTVLTGPDTVAKRFVFIDQVIIVSSGKLLAIEIAMDEDKFFIARDQKMWPGIRCGEFPRSSNLETRLMRVGVMVMSVQEN